MSAEWKHVEIDVTKVEAASVPPSRHHWLSTYRQPVLIVVAITIAVIAWRIIDRPTTAATTSTKTSAIPVVLATAQQANISDHLSGIGTVQAVASAMVRVRVDGQLQQINFAEGQDVKVGDVLAQIDPQALQAQLSVAEAQQARDQAVLTNARADFERYAELVKTGAIAKQALDTQKALVAQQEATLLADGAAVEYARVQLSYATIRAPISGRTGVRLVDTGNLVRTSEATGIVVINQIDPVTAVFTLPENSLRRVNAAIGNSGAASLKVLAFDSEATTPVSEGKLLVINNQIDTNSGTVQLKASFPNAQHRLWPGQYVNVQLVLGETRDALVLPAGAVQRGPEGTFVYVVKDDQTVSVQNVEVARLQDDRAVISAGLHAGQVVVAEGQSKLRPGSAVVAQTRSETSLGITP